MDLTGKVAVVTGSGRGLGLAYATELARRAPRSSINDVDADVADRPSGRLPRRVARRWPRSCRSARASRRRPMFAKCGDADRRLPDEVAALGLPTAVAAAGETTAFPSPMTREARSMQVGRSASRGESKTCRGAPAPVSSGCRSRRFSAANSDADLLAWLARDGASCRRARARRHARDAGRSCSTATSTATCCATSRCSSLRRKRRRRSATLPRSASRRSSSPQARAGRA